jgi:hypothetical protein
MSDENKVIMAYKGFDKSMQCRGFQYKVGETFEHTGRVKACDSGFHACENPLDVLSYYDICDSRFAVVEMSGELSRHGDDSKIASAKINIKAELSLPQFIGYAIDWVKQACNMEKPYFSGGNVRSASGDYSQLAASGDYSKLAASGDYSKLAASGDYSKLAASGDYSKLAASGNSSKLAASGNSSKLAASGYYSQLAASGDSSQLAASGYSSKLAASGESSIAVASAIGCAAKAGELGCIALTRWVASEKRYRMSVAYVGENGIKADTFYCLDDSGNFVEAE